jgi:hypothetical protein
LRKNKVKGSLMSTRPDAQYSLSLALATSWYKLASSVDWRCAVLVLGVLAVLHPLTAAAAAALAGRAAMQGRVCLWDSLTARISPGYIIKLVEAGRREQAAELSPDVVWGMLMLCKPCTAGFQRGRDE